MAPPSRSRYAVTEKERRAGTGRRHRSRRRTRRDSTGGAQHRGRGSGPIERTTELCSGARNAQGLSHQVPNRSVDGRKPHAAPGTTPFPTGPGRAADALRRSILPREEAVQRLTPRTPLPGKQAAVAPHLGPLPAQRPWLGRPSSVTRTLAPPWPGPVGKESLPGTFQDGSGALHSGLARNMRRDGLRVPIPLAYRCGRSSARTEPVPMRGVRANGRDRRREQAPPSVTPA
jgi:hypothetical protein